jgi:AcrR family transcriptional regulator
MTDDARLAIVEAAAKLLRDQGVRAVTTRRVAQAAGVQAPTIYRLFGDKDGLVDAVAEHVMAGYVATKAPDLDADPVADLRAGWTTHVAFGLENPELHALLGAPGRPASPATAAGIEVLRARVRRLATAGLLRVDEPRALAMIHAAGSGTILALLSAPPGERDPGLSAAMFDAVAASILTHAPASPAGELSTAAITFATVVADLPALSAAERGLLTEWLARAITALRDT